MSFGKKTGCAAFFADLGREVVRLSEAPTTFINPVCIGKSVQICPDSGLTCTADLYVTPGGAVAVAFPSLTAADKDSLQCAAAVLRSWDHDRLDDIATDYFFETEGQGALVIDVMARLGFMGYSGRVSLYSAIDKTLACGDTLLIAGDLPFSPVKYSRRQFIDLFCANSGIDPDDMTGFICEMEAQDGVAATVLGSDLVVSYTPAGDKLPIQLFYFKLSANRSDLCVSPRTLRYALEKNSLPLSSADDLFSYFSGFADMGKIKPSPEDGSVGLLYLVPDAIFSEAHELAERVKTFSQAIS